MGRISVTRHVEFEAAHMLSDYDGLCQNLHGHSYKLEVTVSCPEFERKNNKFNFVVDFSKLNKLLKEYIPDHCFIYNSNCEFGSPEYSIAEIIKGSNMRSFEMNNSPSAENMVKKFAKDLQNILDIEFPSMECFVEKLNLWETTNSFATWMRNE